MDSALVGQIRRHANLIRQHVIQMSVTGQGGHQGGALSLAEIMAVLYFHVLRVDAKRPDWPDRDRLVLSKGHGCLALYSALAQRGFFSQSEFSSFDQVGSILQAHPDMRRVPGVEMSTGCLGQGLSTGIGMALGARLDGAGYRTYVILGDGELQSGQVWEAVMFASAYKLDNLTAVVDRNGLQVDGATEDVMPLEPLPARWHSFGWNCSEVDGHDVQALVNAFGQAAAVKGRPTVIIARTVKGKGVSFMENSVHWHGAVLTAEEARLALEELRSEETR
jgi:transketolase